MRSRKSGSISRGEVHQWTLNWLLESKLLKDHGWLCTASVVWNIVLRAAARLISVTAACRDLANAPSDQAVFNALSDGLPKTRKVLERRLNEALTFHLPRRLRRRTWEVAIDFHLEPYYGEPSASKNELYYGEPRQGTTTFHAYAIPLPYRPPHIIAARVRDPEKWVPVFRIGSRTSKEGPRRTT